MKGEYTENQLVKLKKGEQKRYFKNRVIKWISREKENMWKLP